MNYIENTYICLAAPILLAIICMRRDGRRTLIFLLAGMTACLLAAYVSTFIAGVFGVDAVKASFEISPAVEEVLKLLPLLFYVLVFRPEKKHVLISTLMVAVGFATFENVCFLTSYGTSQLLQLLIRGFGTGAMHVVCGMVIYVGMFLLWDRIYLQAAGTFALLCFVITFHAVFNIFVNQQGVIFWIGSVIPLLLVFIYLLFIRHKIVLS